MIIIKVNINNYKYYPWYYTKSIERSFNWEEYFELRMNQVKRMNERINSNYGFLRQLEEERLIQYQQEMEDENARWELVLADICKLFDTDIEDVRTFISPNSSVFKISKEDLILKHEKLIHLIKDPMILKNIISTSEIGRLSTKIASGVWDFNTDMDINTRFNEVKEYLRIDSIDFFELAKIDATYFRSILDEKQQLERKVSDLAFALDISVDGFISLLHEHPYLIHMYPKRIKFNLEWMIRCFHCKRSDLLSLMHQYPPIIFWNVTSLGNIFKMVGYSFSKQFSKFDDFKKVVVSFFENGYY